MRHREPPSRSHRHGAFHEASASRDSDVTGLLQPGQHPVPQVIGRTDLPVGTTAGGCVAIGQNAPMHTSAVLHLSLPVCDLAASREFYVDVLGCRLGRAQVEFVDVWFYGLQLTLQRRPDEVRPVTDQGARHFGVALPDKRQFDDLVQRLRTTIGVHWVTQPIGHPAETLSGKSAFKIADPSGNVIEIKHYADPTEFLALEP